MSAEQRLLRAYARYGPQVERVAGRYRNPVTGERLSGAALLAKLVKGESGGRGNAVSSAGARGYGQFMPGTRQAVLQATGGKVDPWRSPEEAVRGAVMHLTGALGHREGLEGYNPGGGQGYVNYILGQKVGKVSSRSGTSGGSRGGYGGNRPAREESYRTVTTPGIDRSGERQAAKLAYLAERGKPGALIGLKQQLDSLADTAPVSRRVRVEGDSPQERSGGVRGASTGLDGDRNPIRGRKGKLIGVPHSGTHTLGNWQSDNAIDLGVPNGTVLESVADGVVEKVKGGYSGGASRFDGYQVTIRGEDGRRYFYTHLSKTHMRPGQRIRRGQAVGRSGSANGVPHLHLGVERGDARRYR